MEELILYFSHPTSTYGSLAEKKILEDMRDLWPEYQIVLPSNLGTPPEGVSCKKCMESMKTIYFPWIKKSSILAIWIPLLNCRMKCEIYYAGQLGKELLNIVYHPQEIVYEELSLREFYYMDEATETE